MQVFVIVNKQGQPENVFADYDTALYAVETMLDFAPDHVYWQGSDDAKHVWLGGYVHCFELNRLKVVRPKSVLKTESVED